MMSMNFMLKNGGEEQDRVGNERERPVGRSYIGTRCRRVRKFLSAGLQLRWPPSYVAELHKRRRTSRKFANGLLTQPVPLSLHVAGANSPVIRNDSAEGP